MSKFFGQQSVSSFQDITPDKANQLIESNTENPDFVLLDVRTPEEYAAGHLNNAVLRDFYARDFREQIKKLDHSKTYLVYCRSGNRSSQTLKIMQEEGFQQAYNMSGGITLWRQKGLPIY